MVSLLGAGHEVLKGIRLFSEVPVIILTVREEESAVVKATTIINLYPILLVMMNIIDFMCAKSAIAI